MKGLNDGHEISTVCSSLSTVFESAVHICDSSGEPVADTRDQLLALCSTVRLTNERPHVPHKLKRRRGSCAQREHHNR